MQSRDRQSGHHANDCAFWFRVDFSIGSSGFKLYHGGKSPNLVAIALKQRTHSALGFTVAENFIKLQESVVAH